MITDLFSENPARRPAAHRRVQSVPVCLYVPLPDGDCPAGRTMPPVRMGMLGAPVPHTAFIHGTAAHRMEFTWSAVAACDDLRRPNSSYRTQITGVRGMFVTTIMRAPEKRGVAVGSNVL